MKTVVYSAIPGANDGLMRQPETGDRFVAFAGNGDVSAKIPWEICLAEKDFGGAIPAAKWHKTMPHVIFSDCSVSLWIDAGVVMTGHVTVAELARRHLQDADIAVFRHAIRNCLYDEICECIKKDKGNRTVLYRQACRYTQERHPENNGLADTAVLLRRHTEAVRAFNSAWWDELRQYPPCDRISFNFVAHKMGLRISYLPGTICDNALFRKASPGHEKGLRRFLGRGAQFSRAVGIRLHWMASRMKARVPWR